MLINYFPAVISAGGAFTYNYATELPESGEENELIIIVDETPSEYYLDTNEPESPADNAVWFMIGNVGTVSVDVAEEANFAMTLQAAKIYDAATLSWANCSGYIWQDGAWAQFAVGLPPYDTLENTSWSEIRTVSDLGMAEEYWAVGDEKTVMVNGTEMKVRIAGFNHFETNLSTAEKKGIAFEFTTALPDRYAYDADGPCSWGDSDIRATLNSTFLATLPEDLQTVIRDAYPFYLSDDLTTMRQTVCKIFILSGEECNINSSYLYAKETAQTEPLAYHAAGNKGGWTLLPEDECVLTRSFYNNSVGELTLFFINQDSRVASGPGTYGFQYVIPAFVV